MTITAHGYLHISLGEVQFLTTRKRRRFLCRVPLSDQFHDFRVRRPRRCLLHLAVVFLNELGKLVWWPRSLEDVLGSALRLDEQFKRPEAKFTEELIGVKRFGMTPNSGTKIKLSQKLSKDSSLLKQQGNSLVYKNLQYLEEVRKQFWK